MDHTAEVPAGSTPTPGAPPEPSAPDPGDAAAMIFGTAEAPSSFGLLPLAHDPAEYAPRMSTRTWATIAAVALLLATVSGGAAAALWRQNAGLSQQVVDVQREVRDVTEQIAGLSSNAEVVDGTADDLASRVATLEQATQQLSQLEGLAQRLGALEATTQELANRPVVEPGVSSADLSALDAQLDALTSQVDALTSQVDYLRSLVQYLCSTAYASQGVAC